MAELKTAERPIPSDMLKAIEVNRASVEAELVAQHLKATADAAWERYRKAEAEGDGTAAEGLLVSARTLYAGCVGPCEAAGIIKWAAQAAERSGDSGKALKLLEEEGYYRLARDLAIRMGLPDKAKELDAMKRPIATLPAYLTGQKRGDEGIR